MRSLFLGFALVLSASITACSAAPSPTESGTSQADTTSAPASQPLQCEVASDCKGFLPMICQKCADGTDTCAHWDCAVNTCKSSICQDHGGAAVVAPPVPTDATCDASNTEDSAISCCSGIHAAGANTLVALYEFAGCTEHSPESCDDAVLDACSSDNDCWSFWSCASSWTRPQQ